ncbi:hypothetical protein M0R45_028188 [Rubus argutus]|uniref:Uncharacterized protein n=1 Tax=Rubus argutus TaxID=59490 RepID=A0AAW1W546_RUBAR
MVAVLLSLLLTSSRTRPGPPRVVGSGEARSRHALPLPLPLHRRQDLLRLRIRIRHLLRLRIHHLHGHVSSAAETPIRIRCCDLTRCQASGWFVGSARALQRDLDRIAETANTSTSEGLSYVLIEATVALLRHPVIYWISSYSSVTPNHNMEDAEKCFNKISIEERAKFDEETLVNVNNRRRKTSTGKKDDGKHKLPTINSSADLKEALENLGSIPSNNILAAEVLWTPQQENDTLSVEELIEDYPLLFKR